MIPGGKSPNGDNYVPFILQLLLKTSGKISSGDLNEMYWYQIPTTRILEIIYKFSDTCLWRKSVKCLWPLSVPVSLLNCPLEHHHGHFEDDWWGWQDITDDKEANSQCMNLWQEADLADHHDVLPELQHLWVALHHLIELVYWQTFKWQNSLSSRLL